MGTSRNIACVCGGLLLAGLAHIQACFRRLGADAPGAGASVTYDAVEHRCSLSANGTVTVRYTIDLDDTDVAAAAIVQRWSLASTWEDAAPTFETGASPGRAGGADDGANWFDRVGHAVAPGVP